MANPLRPELRELEFVPVGSEDRVLFEVQDPSGFGSSVVMPYGAVLLASMMDGENTLAQIQEIFKREAGVPVPLRDLEELVRRLDEACLLNGPHFRRKVDEYLCAPVRPPTHAGLAYDDQPEDLREQLAGYFTAEGGPGPIAPDVSPDGRELRGLISPHIDLHRGGTAFAWAYKQVVEHCRADLFVIFGTAHNPMDELVSVSRKDFATPLGVVRTDQAFIDRLAEDLGLSLAGRQIDLFADELTHRTEHSIEFQTLMLQYVLGDRREFRIVPVLVNSFYDFMAEGSLPGQSPELQAFLAAISSAASHHPGNLCYISGADFAHIGPRFGDEEPVDEPCLAEQSDDDRKLLDHACRCDAPGFYRHVADQDDCRRICGLAPTYTVLELLGPARGELLKYDQAVADDRSECVTFASVALFGTT